MTPDGLKNKAGDVGGAFRDKFLVKKIRRGQLKALSGVEEFIGFWGQVLAS